MPRMREHRVLLFPPDGSKRGGETRLGIHLCQVQMCDGTEDEGLEEE